MKNFASFPEAAIVVTALSWLRTDPDFYLYLGHLRNFGRVPLFLGHGSDDDNTTAMSSDAILDTYARSARVWFPDKEQGWISGEVTQAGKGAGDKVKLQFIDERGKVHSFNLVSFLRIFSFTVCGVNKKIS